jgi:DNA-binding transcriptional regulator YiaG
VNMTDGPLEAMRIQAIVIHRRRLLDRDRPVNFKLAINELRSLTGWKTSELCRYLNVPRATLWHWETDDEPNPGFEDGRAILKALELFRNRPPTGT